MSRTLKIVLIGLVGIIAYDVILSLASRSLGFPYWYGSAGSLLIYAAVGYSIGRFASVPYAVAGAANVALGDATIGWWLSWIIGPGKPQSVSLSPKVFATTFVMVIVIGGLIGACGAIAARLRRTSSP